MQSNLKVVILDIRQSGQIRHVADSTDFEICHIGHE